METDENPNQSQTPILRRQIVLDQIAAERWERMYPDELEREFARQYHVSKTIAARRRDVESQRIRAEQKRIREQRKQEHELAAAAKRAERSARKQAKQEEELRLRESIPPAFLFTLMLLNLDHDYMDFLRRTA